MIPPIAWTIAGSDSGGGAGVQADMAAMRAFKTHPCSVITALTAQNSVEVSAVDTTSTSMVQAQLDALARDLPAKAIKIGMLASVEQVLCIADFIQNHGQDMTIVLDPVAVSTSGATLAEENVLKAIQSHLLPLCTLVTPNIHELSLLVGNTIQTHEQIMQAATTLLERGAKAVLVKGGHASWQGDQVVDHFLSASLQFSLTQPRQETVHSHGTGCTLAAAIAAACAHGALLEDAVIEANAYVHQGLRKSVGLGKGPGPVAQTHTPVATRYFPSLQVQKPAVARSNECAFPQTAQSLGLYPVVSNLDVLTQVLEGGVKTVQLRVKHGTPHELEHAIERAVALGKTYDARVFINDHWALAMRYGAYGVHLGQEDLDTADLDAIAAAGMRLGISTHGYFELLRAMALRPSYIALGHVFPTPTKVMKSAPQGLEKLRHYAELAQDFPTVAIGGIDLNNAADVMASGVGSIAVVRAISEAPCINERIKEFSHVIGS